MRSRYLVLAGAVFAGGMLAAANAQEGKPFDALRAALNSVIGRVAALEQQMPTLSQLTASVSTLTGRVSGLEQEVQAIPQLNSSMTALTGRVSTLEQEAQSIPGLRIADGSGQPIGRAVFNGNSTYVLLIVDGIAAAYQVSDSGFRQAVAPTVWSQSADCTGDGFLTNDTGVIRQGLVIGSVGVYAKGQFRQLQFRSRRTYPAGTCAALTFTTTGAELATIDLSAYQSPFTILQ
jgi:hypothetical protein